METKVCTKCKVEKQTTEFNKCKSNKDGLYHYCIECRKEYRKQNSKSINEYSKKYYTVNLDNQLKRKKTYRENNKDKIKNYSNNYRISKYNNDSLYILLRKIRNLIYNYLKTQNNKTNTKSYQIIGCTSNQFKLHLESQFQDWMNWDNYGKYNGQPNYGWDIDHIIPNSSAKTEEDIIRLNHYTNLRPRCSYLNRVEDNRKYKTNN
jgi:hypothetical protein